MSALLLCENYIGGVNEMIVKLEKQYRVQSIGIMKRKRVYLFQLVKNQDLK